MQRRLDRVTRFLVAGLGCWDCACGVRDHGPFFPTLALAFGACLQGGWNFLLSMLTAHLGKSSLASDAGN